MSFQDYLDNELELVQRQIATLEPHYDTSVEAYEFAGVLEKKLELIKSLSDIEDEIQSNAINVESETIKFNNPEWRD